MVEAFGLSALSVLRLPDEVLRKSSSNALVPLLAMSLEQMDALRMSCPAVKLSLLLLVALELKANLDAKVVCGRTNSAIAATKGNSLFKAYLQRLLTSAKRETAHLRKRE